MKDNRIQCGGVSKNKNNLSLPNKFSSVSKNWNKESSHSSEGFCRRPKMMQMMKDEEEK